jgi:hypothetical protein
VVGMLGPETHARSTPPGPETNEAPLRAGNR